MANIRPPGATHKRQLSRAGNLLLADIDRMRLLQSYDSLELLQTKITTVFPTSKWMKELLIGEHEFEMCLTNFGQNESDEEAARQNIRKAMAHAQAALEDPSILSEEIQECNMLLARGHCVLGEHKEAVDLFGRINYEGMGGSLRGAALIAQARVCYGMALEGLVGSSLSTMDDAMLQYERSLEISMKRIFVPDEKSEKAPPEFVNTRYVVDSEYGAFRFISYHLAKAKKVEQCVSFLRALLSSPAVSPRLHRVCLQLLRCHLLRSGPGIEYVPPALPVLPPSSALSPSKGSLPPSTSSSSPPSPLFGSMSCEEEAALLLLLEETYFLSRHGTHPHVEDLEQLYHNISAILPSYKIASKLLLEIFQRGIVATFGNVALWLDIANTYQSLGQYTHADRAYAECMRKDPSCDLFPILRAQLALVHLDDPAKALEHAEAALRVPPTKARYEERAQHLRGVACAMLGRRHDASTEERRAHRATALIALHRAFELDVSSSMVALHLALLYADLRDLPNAFRYVKHAIELDADNVSAYRLLALLLSAENKLSEGLVVCTTGLDVDPSHVDCLLLAAAFLRELGLEQNAFQFYTMILRQSPTEGDVSIPTPSLTPTLSESRSRSALRRQILDAEFADVESIAPSIEGSLSLLSFAGKNVNLAIIQNKLSLKTKLWLLLAEGFWVNKRYDDALRCVEEAEDDAPFSADIECCHGRLAVEKGEVDEGIGRFQNALVLDPRHEDSLLYLGMALYSIGNVEGAAHHLTVLTSLNPNSHQGWSYLGLCLRDQGAMDKACDCFLAATDLERTAPICPFNSLPFTF